MKKELEKNYLIEFIQNENNIISQFRIDIFNMIVQEIELKHNIKSSLKISTFCIFDKIGFFLDQELDSKDNIEYLKYILLGMIREIRVKKEDNTMELLAIIEIKYQENFIKFFFQKSFIDFIQYK